MPSLVYKRKQTKIRQDMKTRAFFFMVCIWLLATNGFAQNTIKGDGNIITKEISISDFFLGGVASKCPEALAAVVDSAGYVAVCWLFLYFLYRKNVFLKV